MRDAGGVRIDLNADLGESFGAWTMGDDAALLDVVTSANVACGFHAGDPSTLRATVAAAAARGVRVGAHPGYRDLAGFGRRFLDVAPADLTADVLYQLGALDAMCRAAGTRLHYVKPHGALYNAIVHHRAQADAVVAAVRAFDADLPLLCLPGSAVLVAAREAGLRGVAEAFADRAYAPDGTLVPRREPGAVIHDEAEVVERAVRLASDATVVAIDGSIVRVEAESLCVHGDTPGAARLAAAVADGLRSAGVRLAPFVP